MKGSFRIARFFGIPVELHWTFGLIFLWVFYVVYDKTGRFDPLVLFWQTLFVLSIFLCVLLHEFGHALTARKYGVKTLDIILSPIGGVARLDRMPEKPIQEFWVAIAGPLVNGAIIVILSAYVLLLGNVQRSQFLDLIYLVVNPQSNTFFTADLSQFDFYIFGLIGLNAALAIFNLVPAFPLDGGRIFRALLSMRLPRLKATRIASLTGQVMAIALAVYGLATGNLITTMIGVFVYSTAAAEFRFVKMEETLNNARVADLVRKDFTTLINTWSTREILELLPHSLEKYFLVWDEQEEKYTGWVSEQMILQATKQAEAPFFPAIGEIQRSKLPEVQSEAPLKTAFNLMREEGASIVLVKEEEAIIGVLDMTMVEHFMAISRGLKKGAGKTKAES